jgi:hypothetical protein
MSPHRKRRKNKDGTKVLVGSFAFDRIIRGVGRFRVASGTLDKKVFRRLNDMIDALLDQGRLDLIIAMKSGKLTMMQVYNAYRMGELDRLPSVDQLIPAARCARDVRDDLRVLGQAPGIPLDVPPLCG